MELIALLLWLFSWFLWNAKNYESKYVAPGSYDIYPLKPLPWNRR